MKRQDGRSITEIFAVILGIVGLITGIAAIGLIVDTNSVDDKNERTYDARDDKSSDLSTISGQALQSVVSITVLSDDKIISSGTGFVYTNKYIITNQHVIDGNVDEVYITYRQGEYRKASIVGSDVYTDIAVLKPDNQPGYAKPLPLQEQLPNRGKKVVALGSPSNLQGTVTSGIVSGTERTTSAGKFSIPDMIQTDAALNPGNSGGPLVSVNGDVVGMNRARQGDNIGFAISTRLFDRVATSIIENGKHENPYIGIQTVEINPIFQNQSRFPVNNGLIVVGASDETGASQVFNSGNASRLNGDIITEINGVKLNRNEDLSSYLLRETSPGDAVEFKIRRNDSIETKRFKLKQRPEINDTNIES
jgi:S1-C subfamily serine protease